MKVKVQTLDAKAGGDIQLDDAVFGIEPRADILHRVVTWQLINRRAPARAARERSDVARTGKKFGRQKGGGTARHGDRRAPIFVGGGKAHGPRARVFTSSLNKKVRALGLKMALSAKAKGGQLIVLDNLDMGSEAKTKALQAKLSKLGFGKTELVIDGDPAALGAGHRALDENKPASRVRTDHLEVLLGAVAGAHVSRHLLVLEYFTRILSLSGGAVRAVRDRDAVGGSKA